jgi:hypothetical protein
MRAHFHILVHVISHSIKCLAERVWQCGHVPEFNLPGVLQTGLVLLILFAAPSCLLAEDVNESSDLEKFSKAWRAAAQGSRADFEQLMPELEGYLLYPYLRYEDLRYRRARVPPLGFTAAIRAR